MRARDLEQLVIDTLEAKLPDAEKVAFEQRSIDLNSYVPKSPDVVLVQYRGSSFQQPNPAMQQRRYRMVVFVGSRSLRADGHGGALDRLDDVRTALTGMRFPDMGAEDGAMYPEFEDFFLYAKSTSMWWYQIQFAANGQWHRNKQ